MLVLRKPELAVYTAGQTVLVCFSTVSYRKGWLFSPLHSGLWLELAHSLAEYLCCRLFFPKWIVTSSLHFSKMNFVLLSTMKWNFLRSVYAFLICVLVFFMVSSAKDIYFLKGMPSSVPLKKILNIIYAFNNISFRSNLIPPHHWSSHFFFIKIWGLVLNSWDNSIHRVATVDSWVNTEGKKKKSKLSWLANVVFQHLWHTIPLMRVSVFMN